VFKALADPTRRALLDLLFHEDGQTLNALCDHFGMSRYGIMKHLRILEEAQLVTTRKVGRSKYHYLNPVPIQQAYDRWVSKYAQPFMTALTGLKSALESETMTEQPAHLYQIYIRTTPERLWQALTDGEITPQYYFGTRVESTWKPGDDYQYVYATDEGGVMIKGKVVEIDPPNKLVTTFTPAWVEGDQPETTVIFEIEQVGATCKLTLTHQGLAPTNTGIIDGWSQILSGLKTYLETGAVMAVEA